MSGLWGAGFFALCAFLFWRKEVVVFDTGRQQAAWWRRRAFKAASGTVPFSEITGIGMQSGKDNVTVTLGKPVPVFIVYGTALAYANGEVHFSDDIYGFDGKLAAALAKGYPYP